MKLIFTTLLIFTYTSAFSQPYTDNDVLLQCKRTPRFIILQDTVAYLDYDGGIKYNLYFIEDTLVKKNDGIFISKSHKLRMQDKYWELMNDENKRILKFKKADSINKSYWVHNLNAYRFRDIEAEVEKVKDTIFYRMIKNKLEKLDHASQSWQLSLDEYRLLLENFISQYNMNYNLSAPQNHFKPWSYHITFIDPRYRSKK